MKISSKISERVAQRITGTIGDSILEPIISGITSAQEFDFENIDLAGGGMMIDVTYANAYSLPTANQVALYIGTPSGYADRILQQQYKGSVTTTEMEMRNRVRVGGVEQFAEDYNFTLKFSSARQKMGIRYNIAAGSYESYMNGIKYQEEPSGITFPTNTGMKLCFGKIAGITSLNVDGTVNDGEYFTNEVTDADMRRSTRNTELVSGNTLDSSRSGLLIIGESNGKGPSTITGVSNTYTNSARVKNLGLNGVYGAVADVYMDATGNLFKNSIYQASTAGVAYAPLIADGLAASSEWYTVGAAEGGTSFETEWKLRDANGQMNDLMFAAGVRMLKGMQVGTMKAIVLITGVNDALDGTTETNFKDRVTEAIAELRAIRGEDIPLIIMGMHAWDSDTETQLGITETQWNNTDGWLSDLGSSISNAAYVDNSDLPGRSGDKAHNRFSDYPTLGSRGATQVAAMV